ncbi:HD domain-containing protein [Rossellomorea marisflavi]|uniref:HD domain-containing protein n=1 Tax=Rossellomorea marisflavi TaxID=189381 RepID=UPI003FA030DE
MNYTLMNIFKSDSPSDMLRDMHRKGKLKELMPEISELEGVIQPEKHHPEGDVLEHSLQVLACMERLTKEPAILYTALVHDVGKGITPKELLPKHHQHEKNGVPIVKRMSQRLRVPENWAESAKYGTLHHGTFHKLLEMRSVKVVDFLYNTSKNPLGIEGLAQLGLCDHRGRNNPDGTHECVEPWLEMWDYLVQHPPLPHERPEDARVRQGNGIKRIQKKYTRGQ